MRGNNHNNYNNNDDDDIDHPLILTPIKSKLKRNAALADDSVVLSLHDFKFILDI